MYGSVLVNTSQKLLPLNPKGLGFRVKPIIHGSKGLRAWDG